MERTQLTPGQIQKAIDKCTQKLIYRLDQKGNGTFASSHEILGVITEEYNELIEAVRKHDYYNMQEELLDIAVGCIFSVACLREGTVDW